MVLKDRRIKKRGDSYSTIKNVYLVSANEFLSILFPKDN